MQVIRTILLVFVFGILPVEGNAQDSWLMKAHDTRRTGQSQSFGPRSIDGSSWSVQEPGAFVINVGASVTNSGVFYGSWGLLRKDSTKSVLFWDKSDGQVFGRNIADGSQIWGGPGELDLVPRCYELPSRARDGNDLLWCGLGNDYHVTFYNGTVEGQAAIDTTLGLAFFGRGDGKVYAVNTSTGNIEWRFTTFNPQFIADPDGGGEVVSSPLLSSDGSIYFGTWGEGKYETNAFYSIDSGGSLNWRFPADSSLAHRLFASPALSPDGSTVYTSTFTADDAELPGYLYAFNTSPEAGGSDDSRLKWKIQLGDSSTVIHTTTLAVGSDGTIYVGGLLNDGTASFPTILAVTDPGDRGEYKWTPNFVELRDGAHMVLGIALREVEGETVRIYATTANVGGPLWNAKTEGELYAIDTADGSVLANYDPSDDIPSAVGGITSPAIGADGIVYFGVRGRYGNNAVNGHYFGVQFNESAPSFSHLWNYEVDGYIEWNHPAIGPDGALYGGSSIGGSGSPIAGQTHDEGTIPDGSTPNFYALRGPTGLATDVVSQTREWHRVFPNPSNGYPTLQFFNRRQSDLNLRIVDLLGRVVADSHLGTFGPGKGESTLDTHLPGRQLPAGLYFVILQRSTGRLESIEVSKMVLVGDFRHD